VRWDRTTILPILMTLAILPLGLEVLLHHFDWLPGVLLYLISSFPELGLIVWLYGRTIGWQGRSLHAREQRILAVITTKVE
jgi:hypothetical protein